jgi:arsenate reductase
MRKRYNLLFLCTDNGICSIMAEAILKRWSAGEFHAFSAGVQPRPEPHPLTVEVLKEQRVWHQALHTKDCDAFRAPDAPRMDFIITVGERPPAELPTGWPGNPKVMHWRITDPAAEPDSAHPEHAFRKAFLELENRIKLFVLVYQRDAMRRAATAA